MRTAETGGRARAARCQDPPEMLCLGRPRTELLDRRGAIVVSCRALRWSESDLGTASGLPGCIYGTRSTGYRCKLGVPHTRNSRCSNSTSKSTGSLRYLMGRMVNCENCRSMWWSKAVQVALQFRNDCAVSPSRLCMVGSRLSAHSFPGLYARS